MTLKAPPFFLTATNFHAAFSCVLEKRVCSRKQFAGFNFSKLRGGGKNKGEGEGREGKEEGKKKEWGLLS